MNTAKGNAPALIAYHVTGNGEKATGPESARPGRTDKAGFR